MEMRMRQIRNKGLFAVAATVCMLVVWVFGPSVAHASPAMSATDTAMAPEKCQVLLVHLNGTLPPATSCARLASENPPGRQNSSRGIAPQTGSGSCGDTLNLWVDAYQSGDEICFSGAGFANLTDFKHCYWRWFPPTTWVWDCSSTWNDLATSWASHNQSGAFFSDTSGNGIRMNYSANRNGNFTSNPIPNDSLSSICINNGCP